MHFSISPIILTLAGLSTVTAQYTNQSRPFNLIVESQNTTINGSSLFAAHEGAAIEALALGTKLSQPSPSFATFNHNTSIYNSNTNYGTSGTPGVLTYLLRGGNFNESEGLYLYGSPTSNVALPLFEPGTATQVAFDTNGYLNVQGYVDDSTYPPTVLQGTVRAYYRWYVCMSYYNAYQYHTLNWVFGDKAPQNPTCVKVQVRRLFV